MTEPTALPDDSNPPAGWIERRGRLRFYAEQRLLDGIATIVSASMIVLPTGQHVVVWTVSARHTIVKAGAWVEAYMVGEAPGTTQAEAQAAFETEYRRALDVAIAQVRAAMTVGRRCGLEGP